MYATCLGTSELKWQYQMVIYFNSCMYIFLFYTCTVVTQWFKQSLPYSEGRPSVIQLLYFQCTYCIFLHFETTYNLRQYFSGWSQVVLKSTGTTVHAVHGGKWRLPMYRYMHWQMIIGLSTLSQLMFHILILDTHLSTQNCNSLPPLPLPIIIRRVGTSFLKILSQWLGEMSQYYINYNM